MWLNLFCEISHIMMPNFVKSCAWEPSSVLQLKRMMPSISLKMGTRRWISFVKSVVSLCLFSQIMRMRAFFSTSAQTDVAFIFPQTWKMSLKFLHFYWFEWFHKGNSSTSIVFEGKWRQHPSELKYWRRLSCAWFDKIWRYEMHDFTKKIPRILLILKKNEGNMSLNFLCEISDITMPNFVKSCTWEPSSVLQLKRMMPSFSLKIGTRRRISFVKSVISWCLILSNHSHERLLQYFSSNGCCLHFPHKFVDVAEFSLWNHSYNNA